LKEDAINNPAEASVVDLMKERLVVIKIVLKKLLAIESKIKVFIFKVELA